MERCHYPGTISSDTRGGGPWYCRHHAFGVDQSEGGRIVAESRTWRHGTPVPSRVKPGLMPKAPIREPGADESEAA